jgi:hypothetical protein
MSIIQQGSLFDLQELKNKEITTYFDLKSQ